MCVKCVQGYFQDFTGKCAPQNATCRSDEVNVQGYCILKQQNCLNTDALGLCVQCVSSDYSIIQGQCVFIQKCKSTQYLLNGQCIDTPANCLVFNPSSGVCLTCLDGTSANAGLCCPSGQTVYGGQCVALATAGTLLLSTQNSQIPTCLIYHPTTLYCLQCNGKFTVDTSTMKTCK